MSYCDRSSSTSYASIKKDKNKIIIPKKYHYCEAKTGKIKKLVQT